MTFFWHYAFMKDVSLNGKTDASETLANVHMKLESMKKHK